MKNVLALDFSGKAAYTESKMVIGCPIESEQLAEIWGDTERLVDFVNAQKAAGMKLGAILSWFGKTRQGYYWRLQSIANGAAPEPLRVPEAKTNDSPDGGDHSNETLPQALGRAQRRGEKTDENTATADNN